MTKKNILKNKHSFNSNNQKNFNGIISLKRKKIRYKIKVSLYSNKLNFQGKKSKGLLGDLATKRSKSLLLKSPK